MKYKKLIEKIDEFNNKYRNAVSFSISDDGDVSDEKVKCALDSLEKIIYKKIEQGYKISGVEFYQQLIDYGFDIGIGISFDGRIDIKNFDKFVLNLFEKSIKIKDENFFLKSRIFSIKYDWLFNVLDFFGLIKRHTTNNKVRR